MSTELLTVPIPTQYRYDTVKEFQQRLQEHIDVYTVKKKKYQSRITALDITVYTVSGVIASTEIILSSVTMTAPIAIPIVISAVTTLTGIFAGVTKKISSCSASKLRDYTLKLNIATSVYSTLTALISSAITDQEITEDEFSNITEVYNTAMKKLNNDNYNSNENIRNSKNFQRSSTRKRKISNNVEK